MSDPLDLSMSEPKDSVVVPREPTEEMRQAGFQQFVAGATLAEIYKAMLSASPSHPQEKDAERYRHARANSTMTSCGTKGCLFTIIVAVDSKGQIFDPGLDASDPRCLDAAIDRAIKETGER